MHLSRDFIGIPPGPTVYIASDICDIVNDFALQQLVEEPMRQSNILDQVLTNLPARSMNVKETDRIVGSDHCAVQFNILYSTPRNIPPPVNFKKADFYHFRYVLSIVSWNCCFLSESIEDAWSNFKDLLFITANQRMPMIHLWETENRTHGSQMKLSRWSSVSDRC